jgi:hypothetical protein
VKFTECYVETNGVLQLLVVKLSVKLNMFVGSTVVLISRIKVSNYQQFDFFQCRELIYIYIQPGSQPNFH